MHALCSKTNLCSENGRAYRFRFSSFQGAEAEDKEEMRAAHVFVCLSLLRLAGSSDGRAGAISIPARPSAPFDARLQGLPLLHKVKVVRSYAGWFFIVMQLFGRKVICSDQALLSAHRPSPRGSSAAPAPSPLEQFVAGVATFSVTSLRLAGEEESAFS